MLLHINNGLLNHLVTKLYFLYIFLYFFLLIIYYTIFSISENSISEEIEFSRLSTDPNEMLSLTAFARKTAVE